MLVAGPDSTCKVGFNRTIKLIGAGNCTLTATADSSTGTHVSLSKTFVITRPVATTTLIANSNPVLVGQTATLTATVSGSADIPTGIIVFKDGSTALATTPLTFGSASFYSNAFAIGSHSLTADYWGDSTYLPSQGLLNLLVSSTISTTTTVSTAPNPSQIGGSVTVTVGVTPASNVGTLSGTVSVSGDGQSCTITLPAVSCILAFATKGSKTLTATYSGNGSYAASSGTDTHRVGRQPDLTPILMLLLD